MRLLKTIETRKKTKKIAVNLKLYIHPAKLSFEVEAKGYFQRLRTEFTSKRALLQ